MCVRKGGEIELLAGLCMFLTLNTTHIDAQRPGERVLVLKHLCIHQPSRLQNFHGRPEILLCRRIGKDLDVLALHRAPLGKRGTLRFKIRHSPCDLYIESLGESHRSRNRLLGSRGSCIESSSSVGSVGFTQTHLLLHQQLLNTRMC